MGFTSQIWHPWRHVNLFWWRCACLDVISAEIHHRYGLRDVLSICSVTFLSWRPVHLVPSQMCSSRRYFDLLCHSQTCHDVMSCFFHHRYGRLNVIMICSVTDMSTVTSYWLSYAQGCHSRRHFRWALSHTLKYKSWVASNPHPSRTHGLHVPFHRLGSAPFKSGDRLVCLTRVLRCAWSSDRSCRATLRCVPARLLDSHGSVSTSYKHISCPEHGGMPRLLFDGQVIWAEERMDDIWCALVGLMYADDDAAIMERPAMLWTTAVSL